MFPSIPPITWMLLVANGIVYLLQGLLDPELVLWFALWPIHSGGGGMAGFLPWQLVTYSFLHGNLLHLLVNMLALYMFGSDVERVFGERRFLAYYLVCVVTAALAQLLVSAMSGSPPYPTVGASGGVFGVLLAFALYFPHRTVMLVFPPIPMPAWLFVTLYGVLELYLGITGTQAGVAHFAHLGGMLGGYAMIRYWRGRPPIRRRW
ncbi:MAG TPA: rhomboid family intramembrane serine protease [Burkholderiales bacterium]|jgi:membrane associated rhomboid family serine protease|nr:rhomboid family intramembrane serine protease [Burkholderiales bacterium]